MATFLKSSNFNGSNGSHFFIALYYDILSATSVRFYAYVGSHDGYSAGGSSSAVYINNNYVGSISNIAANSNTQVGYVDLSGSGSVTATASCSTPWNGVGSASVSDSITLGDYITSFNVVPLNETSVRYDFTVSSPGDYVLYSLDNINWYELPSNHILGGLIPGQPCNFYIKIRQTSTQVEYTAGPCLSSPYNYPYVTSANDFTIGNPLNITLYNPLNRNCYIYIQANGTQSGAVYTNTGSLSTTFNNDNWVNWWYSTIPNQKQAQFSIRMIVSDFGRDTTVYGGIYSIKYNENPIVIVTATDTDKTLTGGIDPTAKVSDLTNDSTNKTIIKNISDVTVTNTTTTQNYATLSSIAVEGYSIVRGTTSPLSHTFTYVNNITFYGHAIDSRNLKTTTQVTGLTLVPYVRLTLDDIELYRDDETSNTLKCKGSGNYYSGSFGSNGVNNSITFQIRYKESSVPSWEGISWTTKTMTIGSNNDYSFDFTLGTSFDYTKKYDVQVQATDKCMTTGVIEIVAKPGIPIQGLFEEFIENFGTKSFINNNGELMINGDIKVSGSNKYLKNL